MVEVSNLTKQYGGQVVVDALNFTIRPGIVTGFLGPNGAGKSTTMRMIVGLADVADKASGGFSLGMGQRLGIASALLGDPETVMLDEPVNGLDPEGILWIRNLLKHLANEGRTVFVSSHLMTEMALVAEHFIIIGKGKLIADVSSFELEALSTERSVRVRSPQATELRDVLAGPGVEVSSEERDVLTVTGLTSDEIGLKASAARLTLFELTPHESSLEQIFMELTHDSVEYRSGPSSTTTAFTSPPQSIPATKETQAA